MEGGPEERTTIVRRAGLGAGLGERFGERGRSLALHAAIVLVLGGGIATAVARSPDDGGTEQALADEVPCDGRFGEGIDVLVYLDPAATEEQMTAVRRHLELDDRIDELLWVDQRATYEEFKVLFAASPGLIESVTPDILPPSYRLALDDEDDSTTVQEELQHLDGVYEVIDAQRAEDLHGELSGGEPPKPLC